MIKSAMITPVLLSIMLCGLFSPVCHCQEKSESGQMRMVKGRVNDVDWVGSKMTVKYVQDNGYNDEITFEVTDKTKITKGAEEIPFSAVIVSDSVTVEYYSGPKSFSWPEAAAIVVAAH